MPDIKHKLIYPGVNWNKVEQRQNMRWSAKASHTTVVQSADPDKLEEFKRQRQAEGLNMPKKKKGKKRRLNKEQRRARREAKAKLNPNSPIKTLEKNKAILEASPRVTAAGSFIIKPDPIVRPPHVVNKKKKKKPKPPRPDYSNMKRKRSEDDPFGGLPIKKKEQ